MSKNIPPDFKGLMEFAEEFVDGENKEPPKPITQKYPFNSASKNRREIENLKKENADLKEAMAKMEEIMLELVLGKIKEMGEEVKNIKKEVEDLKKSRKGGRCG